MSTQCKLVKDDKYRYSIYDASTKRTRQFTVDVNKFGSIEAMDAHVAGMKADWAAKNAAFREMKAAEPMIDNIEEIAEPVEPAAPAPEPILPAMSKALLKAIDSIRFKDTLSIKLDHGTGNTGALIGSSKSGKSTAMMEIYRKYYRSDKDNIVTLFAQNSHASVYRDSRLIVTDELGATATKYIALEKKINQKTKNEYRFVSLIDDFINVRFNTLVNESIMSYRNSNISSWICIHSAKTLSRTARSSVNWVLLFNSNLPENIEDIVKVFLRPAFRAMGVRDEHDQTELYRFCTQAHGFIQFHPSTGDVSFHRLSI